LCEYDHIPKVAKVFDKQSAPSKQIQELLDRSQFFDAGSLSIFVHSFSQY
jgi:hypothetical protein